MPVFAEHIPEGDRACREGEVGELQLLYPSIDFGILLARLGDAGQISFDIGSEYRHADPAEPFSHHLQSHRFARARCSSYKAVAVCHSREQLQRSITFRNQQRLSHVWRILLGSADIKRTSCREGEVPVYPAGGL